MDDIYEYLAKFEEDYCSIMQGNIAYSADGDILLMASRAKLYCGLAHLEELIVSKGLAR